MEVLVVMGVSGCGKTTVASLLAQRLGWPFAEADTFHSPENVARMRGGVPLTDADRWPWLDALAQWIDGQRAQARSCVVACSALKRAYRERLAAGHDDVRFVYLRGDYGTVQQRLASRSGHYMPASLLKSQFQTLEEPAEDERHIVVGIDAPPEAIVERVAAAIAR